VSLRGAEPLHCVVQALLEIHKSIGGLKSFLQFVPGNGLTSALQEHSQDFDRLTLQPDLEALFAQLT